MNENSFKVVLIAAAVLLMGLLVAQIRRRTRRFLNSAEVCLLRELVRSAQAGELQQEDQPKSLSGMTSIYLPQILRDFPEFNWKEFQQKTENMVKSALRAIDARDEALLVDASEELRRQIGFKVAELKGSGQREYFRNITVHQTEIAHYQKEGGTCAILVQSAVGCLHYTENAAGELVSGSRERRVQTKYNTELVYIQDPERYGQAAGGAVGVSCPNCGAPVTRLGSKFCEYCGSGLREISVRVWSINKITEIL